ncbi:hypothetical protein BCV70DRAFT_232244 [Testicularia cyperi]|uniref:CBM1 domain-containing protein n=1 Tax=Testicularia cyperi TaxID=1882483 RepID=A0A317XMI1_9BASI|nr:hypothetical protein BCV70DRAFT_232244 [Testicularia cyperi]
MKSNFLLLAALAGAFGGSAVVQASPSSNSCTVVQDDRGSWSSPGNCNGGKCCLSKPAGSNNVVGVCAGPEAGSLHYTNCYGGDIDIPRDPPHDEDPPDHFDHGGHHGGHGGR